MFLLIEKNIFEKKKSFEKLNQKSITVQKQNQNSYLFKTRYVELD